MKYASMLNGALILHILSVLISSSRLLVFAQVDPTIISTCADETIEISVTVPGSVETEEVDVVFLFDDTGSFERVSNQVANQLSNIVANLGDVFPSGDFAYGVARYEDYGGPGTDYGGGASDARPFILNQPVLAESTVGDEETWLELIRTSLRRSAPANGGDLPEAGIEGLYQLASGDGFDGNGDGSFNGVDGTQIAGALTTQQSPDDSGDVPQISSLESTVLTSGTIGGMRWRTGAKKIVIVATDICTVAPFDTAGELPSTVDSEFSSEPSTEFACQGEARFGRVGNALVKADSTRPRSIAPIGAAPVQEAVDALVEAGIQVVGLATGSGATPSGSGPSNEPAVWLSAMARLTNALDADGEPLVFEIDEDDPSNLADIISQVISEAITEPVPVEVTPVGCEDIEGLTITIVPDSENAIPGQTATFQANFEVDPDVSEGSCTFSFTDADTGELITTENIVVNVCLGSPTVSPTFGPTLTPTATPTVSPTLAPTQQGPTRAPTSAPTDLPTNQPTTSPPTPSPTFGPTASPTVSPTDRPTASMMPTAPTEAPTFEPTIAAMGMGTSLLGRGTGINFFADKKRGGEYNGIRFNYGDGLDSFGKGKGNVGKGRGKGRGFGSGGSSSSSKSGKGGSSKGSSSSSSSSSGGGNNWGIGSVQRARDVARRRRERHRQRAIQMRKIRMQRQERVRGKRMERAMSMLMGRQRGIMSMETIIFKPEGEPEQGPNGEQKIYGTLIVQKARIGGQRRLASGARTKAATYGYDEDAPISS